MAIKVENIQNSSELSVRLSLFIMIKKSAVFRSAPNSRE